MTNKPTVVLMANDKKSCNISCTHCYLPYEGSIPGANSEGFRFIDQAVNIDEGWYTATFEGNPGKTYRTKMFIQNGYKNIENATFVKQEGNVYELEVVLNELGKQVVKVEF